MVVPAVTARAEPHCPPEEYPCVPDPTLPPGSQPPEVGTITFVERAATSLTMRLRIPRYARSYQLQRQLSTGGWYTVRSGTSTGTPRDVTTTVTGATPDRNYCFRLVATNDVASSTSLKRCAYTKDGHNAPTFRVQVRIQTAAIADAGTADNQVLASINGPYPHVMPEFTFLDHSRNDFERYDIWSYDLAASRISEVGDLNGLTIENRSSDDWCVRGVELWLDEQRMFRHYFGNETCQWLGADSEDTRYVFSHDVLRASSYWNPEARTVPLEVITRPDGHTQVTKRFPRDELIDRVQSAVGNAVNKDNNPLFWGHFYGDPVEVSKLTEQSLRFDVDLAADVPGFDPDVDVNFDIVANAALDNGLPEVDVNMVNFSADAQYSWWEHLVSAGLSFVIESEIQRLMAQEMPRFSVHTDIDLPATDAYAQVTDSADLVFVIVF